ncbi:MAG TPA: ribose 5-phosphate isomerase B [Syntrophomonadaceae bacterium]|nr:ribose 5-phosphate isomerase B [Syntrophomonadaceae bacterium]
MKIAIGNDHAGVALKLEIMEMLTEEGYEVINCGVDTTDSVDYPDIAEQVTTEVLKQNILGVLICGTGIGISIAANKIIGIRAALCQNIYTAQMAREHNDANIVALGARVTGGALAVEIVRAFVKSDFQAGRHLKRVEKIIALEEKHRDRR